MSETRGGTRQLTTPPLTTGVVVATRDRAQALKGTLEQLRALPERPPIVVVDNGSRDRTAQVVGRAGPGVRLVRLARNVGPAARTVGARVLRTEAVAFSDDDSWWSPGSLAKAGRILAAHPRLGLIAARILVGPQEKLDPTCAEMARSPLAASSPLPGPPVLGFVACGAIVRRRAFLEVGGFEGRFGFGGEEELLALDLAAAGWRLAYVEDIVANHHPWEGGAEREGRRAMQLRNRMWVTWLRRSGPDALAQSLSVAVASLRAGEPGALLAAVRGLPWAMRKRRVLPVEVERAVRRLEHA